MKSPAGNGRTIARALLPIVVPIRPERELRVPLGPEWRYEVKLDGFRGLLHSEAEQGWFISKTGNRMKRFEPLARTLARALGVRSVILDGEIVVPAEGIRTDFKALMSKAGHAEYAAFDLLYLNGRDLRSLPYRERKTRLARVLRNSDAIGYVDDYPSPRLLELVIRLDLEGVVAKRLHDTYDASARWIKIKHTGYSQMEGRYEMFSSPKR